MKTHITSDPGLRIRPERRRLLIVLIIIGLLIALAVALTDKASAAPVAGNRGGCGYHNRNMVYGVACTVTDTGRGFVSGTCDYGYWFSRVSTLRTFRLDQAVRVNGCEGLNQELYAPIRIYR